MSGVNRHPRLLADRPTPKSNRLTDVVTTLVAIGMIVALIGLLAAYLGVIG